MLRSFRRHHDERMKARAFRMMRDRWGIEAPDPKYVGINAGVHCRPCSCAGCRHEKDVPPKRVRAALAEAC